LTDQAQRLEKSKAAANTHYCACGFPEKKNGHPLYG
jgi:hypothetical protein